jgi:hypothetical protein
MQTATQFNVSELLTLAGTETNTDSISTTYDCNVEVQLAGDSIWDCELEAVTVTSIHIHEQWWDELDGDSSIHITVCYTVDGDAEYEGSWRLYTDTGFADAISTLLGTEVMFTEQGMQDNNYASMEL